MKASAVNTLGVQQGSADQDEEELCVVCWDRPKEVIFLSCGHMVREQSFPEPPFCKNIALLH